MRTTLLLLLALFTLGSGGLAFADEGYCTAQDSGDAFWKSVCRNKPNKTVCEWEENCRWAYSSSGSCEARDANDGFWRSVCANKPNKTVCGWEEHCVWNE
jgi:hypothetical protein